MFIDADLPSRRRPLLTKIKQLFKIRDANSCLNRMLALNPQSPQPELPEDSTRNRIITVAGELFAEKGFKETTVRDICSLAGVNVAAVNYHFRDKEGLYREVLRLMFIEGATRFPPLQGASDDASPEEKLEAFILSMLRRLFDDGKPAWKMKLMAQEMSNPSPAMQAVIEEGVRPNAATQAKIADWLCDQILLDYLPAGTRREMPRGYSIPLVDLAQQTQRQVTVDREDGQYLGHPSTVLLEDGKTLLCVYPKGHGRGAIVMKRSGDGGLTWSERLPVPENWATSQEVPVLYPATGPEGKRRLLLFSGLYPIRMSLSEDNGASWSPLSPIGDFGGIVAFASMARRKNGDYVGFFHDDGRFLRSVDLKSNPPVFTVYQSVSQDGCLTWAQPQEVVSRSRAALCEPGLVVSPDGARWALLLRENLRRHNSFIVFSEDEGQTWSRPRELPASLTGDRHTARYAPDGRLFVSFRDMAKESPTRGDWAGWVGAWDDLVSGTEGQYRVRLMKNHLNENGREGDCAYPGVELLPDGTFVCTTYGHWTEGAQPWVASVRFRLEELDILRQTMK